MATLRRRVSHFGRLVPERPVSVPPTPGPSTPRGNRVRQRVIKALAAFLLIVAGVAATAVAAGAIGNDESSSIIGPVETGVVAPDSTSWG